MPKMLTDPQNYVSIANSIRAKYRDANLPSETYYPNEMSSAIDDIPLGMNVNVHIGKDGKWHRPAEWPNLDLIEDWQQYDDFEVLYMTFDNRSRTEWVEMCNMTARIEQGLLIDGAFVSIETMDVVNQRKAFELIPYDYPVVRITSLNGVHLTMPHLSDGEIITDKSVFLGSNDYAERWTDCEMEENSK